MTFTQLPDSYICKVCRKPLGDMDYTTTKMMEFMNMPRDSGAHASCLNLPDGTDMPTDSPDKHTEVTSNAPTEATNLRKELEALICDWNAPNQLATDIESTCRKLERYILKRDESIRTTVLEAVRAGLPENLEEPNICCDGECGGMTFDAWEIEYGRNAGNNHAITKVKTLLTKLQGEK